jgi:molybdenum cofactor biosynthesis enzyme
MSQTVTMTGMFDVADKIDTLRMATAQAIIRINPLTSKFIKEGKTPRVTFSRQEYRPP